MEIIKLKTLKERLADKETLNKYQLPPVLTLFVKNFKIEESTGLDIFYYYLPFLEGGEVTFPVTTIEHMIESSRSDEEVVSRGYIQIATNRLGVYIGTVGEEADKVIVKTKSTQGNFKVVAQNVFEFFAGLTDNLSNAANSVEEYTNYMIALGYEGDDLEDEIEAWLEYRLRQGK